MTLDDEGKELIQRLQDIENRILSDKLVEESLLDSIKSLEVIFGKHSKFSELLFNLKSVYAIDKIDSTVKKFINKTNASIHSINASVIGFDLDVNKNSILSDFLMDTGRLPESKLRSFHDFFKNIGPDLKSAFANGNSVEVKRVLREYVEILESEEKYLHDNSFQITKDITYAWSLHNLLNHEIAHIIFNEMSEYKNTYASALNEAYSFSLQKLKYTFEKEYMFTQENLTIEINSLYRLIIPRQHGYSEVQYQFMKPMILLISTLVLCDSIARKEGNNVNHDLFINSYSQPSMTGTYILIKESLDNLKNETFRSILQNTLLKTSLSQLNKCKEQVIDDLEVKLSDLPEFVRDSYITFDKSIPYNARLKWEKKDWTSFRKSLIGPGSIITNNLRQFAGSIDLLRLMEYEDMARKYRDRYIQILETVLNEIAKSVNDKESQIYSQEKDVIDGVIKIIGQEEQILTEILQSLKF